MYIRTNAWSEKNKHVAPEVFSENKAIGSNIWHILMTAIRAVICWRICSGYILVHYFSTYMLSPNFGICKPSLLSKEGKVRTHTHQRNWQKIWKVSSEQIAFAFPECSKGLQRRQLIHYSAPRWFPISWTHNPTRHAGQLISPRGHAV